MGERLDLDLSGSPGFALNRQEREAGHAWLSSTPRHVTLGTHNACNAKCPFCLEGRYARFSLDLYKSFFEAKLGHYLREAETVTFTGFGEVLLIPGIEELLDHLNATLPRPKKIFTTNGTPLTAAVRERLLLTDHIVQVSLHATDEATHERMTALQGEYRGILDNVRSLVAARAVKRRELGLRDSETFPIVKLVDVLTVENVDQLPDFIEMAYELGVQQVRALYMTIFEPAHIAQSCFFDQPRANRAVREAKAVAERLKDKGRIFSVELPPSFGEPPEPGAGRCEAPWEQLYVELQGSVMPCCYWGEHADDLSEPGRAVETVWNGPFYRELRRAMASDQPHPWCRSCVRYVSYNVNDLLCHLTNRPAQQRALLAEIERRRLATHPG